MAKKEPNYFASSGEQKKARALHIHAILPKLAKRIKEVEELYVDSLRERDKATKGDRSIKEENAKGIQAFAMGLLNRYNKMVDEIGGQPIPSLAAWWTQKPLFSEIEPTYFNPDKTGKILTYGTESPEAKKQRARYERLTRKTSLSVERINRQFDNYLSQFPPEPSPQQPRVGAHELKVTKRTPPHEAIRRYGIIAKRELDWALYHRSQLIAARKKGKTKEAARQKEAMKKRLIEVRRANAQLNEINQRLTSTPAPLPKAKKESEVSRQAQLMKYRFKHRLPGVHPHGRRRK